MTTMIPAERLSTGTYIAIPGYDAVQVLEARFDGYGYDLTVCTNDRFGWDATDSHYVPCGSCVEFAGRGEPSLRDPDAAELEALDEAREEAALATLAAPTAFFCSVLIGRYADSLRAASGEEQSSMRAAE